MKSRFDKQKKTNFFFLIHTIVHCQIKIVLPVATQTKIPNITYALTLLKTISCTIIKKILKN